MLLILLLYKEICGILRQQILEAFFDFSHFKRKTHNKPYANS